MRSFVAGWKGGILMRTERNDFQQLMDCQLGNIQWDESKSQAVRRRLRQQSAPKRKPQYRLVFAALTVLLCVAAVSIVSYAPRTDVITSQPVSETFVPVPVPDTRAQAVFLARNAVMEKYGLTLGTLGLFQDSCQLTDTGWVVNFVTTGLVNRRIVGIYTVEKNNGLISTFWSNDDVDPALWQNTTELNTVAWGQQQLVYARIIAPGEATAISQEQNVLDGENINYNYVEDTELWGDPLYDVEPTENDITADQAIAVAREAFQQQFGLDAGTTVGNDGQPILQGESGTLRESDSGIRVWVFYTSIFVDQWNYDITICINAQTGALERLEYNTFSNG